MPIRTTTPGQPANPVPPPTPVVPPPVSPVTPVNDTEIPLSELPHHETPPAATGSALKRSRIGMIVIALFIILDLLIGGFVVVKNMSSSSKQPESKKIAVVTSIPTTQPTVRVIVPTSPIKPTNIPTPLSSPSAIPATATSLVPVSGKYLDTQQQPITGANFYASVTDESTGEIIRTSTSSSDWSVDPVPPGTYRFRMYASSEYKLNETSCTNCKNYDTNGCSFKVDVKEGDAVQMVCTYTK